MFRSCPTGFRPAIFTALALISLAAATQAQERRAHIRVENYTIDADVQPATQALIATAEVRFVPLDNNTSRSEEHTSELQSLRHLVCRLLLEKKKKTINNASSNVDELRVGESEIDLVST